MPHLTRVWMIGRVHQVLGCPDLVLGDVTELAPPIPVHLVLGLSQLAWAAHQVQGVGRDEEVARPAPVRGLVIPGEKHYLISLNTTKI